ncbi:MAG: hypothetical protein LBT46_08320 [Planctomycetaceae bacterium]|jgi:hypothetical protein|nr:hypothetical protein [Planctomycetaceae bacterium]
MPKERRAQALRLLLMPGRLFFVTFFLVLCLTVSLTGIALSGSVPLILERVYSPDKQRTVTLSVMPDVPRLSDTVTLILDVSEARGTSPAKAEFPAFGEKLGELKITDTQMSGRQLVITAIPLRAGKTPIWEMPVKIGSETITLPQCELDIQSEVSPEDASLDNITTDIKPFEVRNPYLIGMIAGAVLLLIAALFLLSRKRKNRDKVSAVPLTLQELTLQKLSKLLESRLHESDVRQFFVELSDTVRWYIEQKTGLRTPELTTEEFLYKTAKNPLFRETEKISSFLQTADFVKFAKHQPAGDDIMLAFHRAEELISFTIFQNTETGSSTNLDEQVLLFQNGNTIPKDNV